MCTHRAPVMAEKLAATYLRIDPEQPPEGALFFSLMHLLYDGILLNRCPPPKVITDIDECW